ncbi:MAG: mannitol dehydrogenase family protein [Treponema sp.]|jgi:fructuronate reductase|nr:mannitol dehydrogenase family protein [Treponema sp.]
MRLNDCELQNRARWEQAGIELPRFNRPAMIQATQAAPQWIHFGAGNIFRIFPAALQQSLLEAGVEKTGIVMVAGRDGGILEKVFKPCDNLTLGVTLKASGAIVKKVIASIAASLWMGNAEDYAALKRMFRSASLQMASLTITEKGYNIKDSKGEFLPDAAADFETGPAGDGSACAPQNYMGKIAALLYERYRAGADSGRPLPIAVVSMDNCSHNGDRLFAAIEAFASAWTDRGRAEKGFLDYIRDRSLVSFPWTMIDKITPGPDSGVKAMLEKDGFEDTELYSKTTPTAPFVNAEEPQYLVIEDAFPAGRPALEKAGALFTDRATVDKVEKMKVCTCLNPLHTALAIFGCLLGYTRISEEMKNSSLVKLIERIGYTEGLPVVVDPGIISPKQFIDEVIKVRIPNPFMPDTPQRIASDSSQKIPIRFGETIKAYLASSALNIHDLQLIPLVLAAWPRYLLGIDDQGKPFTVSPDPLYSSLAPLLAGITLGDTGPFHAALEPILSDSKIFGVNLYEAGLGEKVEAYFAEMLAGPGAVAKALQKYAG